MTYLQYYLLKYIYYSIIMFEYNKIQSIKAYFRSLLFSLKLQNEKRETIIHSFSYFYNIIFYFRLWRFNNILTCEALN